MAKPAADNARERRAEAKRQLERKRIAEVNKGPFAPGVADAPFGHCGRLYRHQMRDFIIAMLPMLLTIAFLWGPRVLILPAAAGATAVACEAFTNFVLRRPVLRTLPVSGTVEAVRTALVDAGIDYESAEASFQPSMSVPVDVDTARKVFKLVDALEDSDDVQNVYTNVDLSDEVLAALDAE